MSLISAWLRECDRKWVIVLDNVDDGYLFESRSGEAPLATFLPQARHGSILMTSRNRGVATTFAFERDVLDVQPMTSLHACSLLERKLSVQSKPEDILRLAEALEFMPLAIVQAAAYINKRAPRTSVERYLEEFLKSDARRVKLLHYEASQPGRDWGARNAILVTWQLSFDDIRVKHPLAADLLSLMCFFDKSGIPGDALHVHVPKDSGSDDGASIDEDEFEDSLLVLRDYSFVSIGQDSSLYEMHRLVQLATREWLDAHDQSGVWQDQFIKCLSDSFAIDPDDEKYWSACRSLFPHVQVAMRCRPSSEKVTRQWASLLFNAGLYAKREANFSDMREMGVISMDLCREVLGSVDHQTVVSTGLAALAHQELGRYDEAEKILKAVIEDCRRDLGPEHPSTLNSMSQLACVYRASKRMTEAISLSEKVVESSKKVFGMEHWNCLVVMENLAQYYAENGLWLKSSAVGSQVVDISKTVLGPEHPRTLDYMNSLADAYCDSTKYQAATQLKEEVFQVRKRTFGPDTWQRFDAMEKMAAFYHRIGRLSEAEELAEQALEGKEKIFGAEHLNTIHAMGNLASIWKDQARYKEAEELLSKRITLLTKILGSRHRVTRAAAMTLQSWQDDKIVDAARAGRQTDLDALLAQGADLNHRDFFWGRSPFSQAAEYGHVGMVKHLLAKGVDPNTTDVSGQSTRQDNKGRTALMWAAMRGRPLMCHILLDHGADTSLVEREGRTALSLAAARGRLKVLKILLEKDGTFDQPDTLHGQTPLSWAAMRGQMDAVELLLAHGADPTIADGDGKRPSAWAEQEGHEQVAEFCRMKEKDFVNESG